MQSPCVRTVLAALLCASASARSATPDCAPLGHLAGYEADQPADAKASPHLHEYDFHDFPRAGAEAARIKGSWCQLRFALQPGSVEPPVARIVDFYKQELAKAGAKVVFEDGAQVTGTLSKNGTETWFHAAGEGGWATAYHLTVVTKGELKPSLTAPSAGDYRLLGHMPGYVVIQHELKEQDEIDFPRGGDLLPAKVQGKRFHYDYAPDGRPKPASDLEVLDNLAGAIAARGGQIGVQDEHSLSARFEDADKLIWVHVFVQGASYALDVVEETPFAAAPAEPPRASALKTALEHDGRITLYVNFDFAKAVLKPDAAPVIAQIVALLKENAGYQVAINGHTDNIGGVQSNQKLSEARAAAVVDAVVKGGIERARLSSAGFGEGSPVATNDTGAGRAKNRRVELVKR